MDHFKASMLRLIVETSSNLPRMSGVRSPPPASTNRRTPAAACPGDDRAQHRHGVRQRGPDLPGHGHAHV